MSQLFFEPGRHPLRHLRGISVSESRGHKKIQPGQATSIQTVKSDKENIDLELYADPTSPSNILNTKVIKPPEK